MRILEDVPLADGGMVCENRGSGLAVIVESLRAYGHPPPEFTDSLAVFEVTFRAASRGGPPEVHESPGIPPDPATTRILSELEHGPISRRELSERTGLASHVVRYRLDKLRAAGVVRRTGAPRDPTGKWFLA